MVEEKIVDEFEKNKSSIVNEVLLDNEKPRTEMAQLRTEVHQSLRKSVVGNDSLIFPAVLYNNLFDPEYD